MQLYSVVLGSRGDRKAHAEPPPYGRGVRGLCIIDEALYRQTKLKHRGARSSASEDGGGGWVVGWVESAGEGLRGDVLFSQLSYCICTALKEREETYRQTQCDQKANANVHGKSNTAKRLMKHLTWKHVNELIKSIKQKNKITSGSDNK